MAAITPTDASRCEGFVLESSRQGPRSLIESPLRVAHARTAAVRS